jgi:zinc D-Ala-D-Ala carboxypeptidase
MNITQNFTLAEFTNSFTATRKGFKEQFEPNEDVIYNLTVASKNVLEKIRSKFGGFSPSSAYRCPRLNKSVGGSESSYHCRGMAFDINLTSRNKELFKYIYENLGFSELIWEYGTDDNCDWVHVAYNQNNLCKSVKRVTKKGTFVLNKEQIETLIN